MSESEMVEVKNLSVEDLVEEGLGTKTVFSPYRLTVICETIMGRMVRPQMVYSYVRQGMIKGSKNSDGKWEITREVGKEWLVKYITKNQ